MHVNVAIENITYSGNWEFDDVGPVAGYHPEKTRRNAYFQYTSDTMPSDSMPAQVNCCCCGFLVPSVILAQYSSERNLSFNILSH